MNIKKCWINETDSGLVSLTIESENPTVNITGETRQVMVKEMTFPKNPTPEHPLRHTINLGLLNEEDVLKLYNTIQEHLGVW